MDTLTKAEQMKKSDLDNTFRLQCLDLKTLSIIQFDRSVQSVAQLLKKTDPLKINRIVASGCGDSFLAAAEAKDCFARYLPEVRYEAYPGIEAGRYTNYSDNEDKTLVIAISNSGGPARIAEILARANRYGCISVALTDHPESRAAKTAQFTYHTNTPAGDNVSGLRTYYASMISMYVLAAALAEKRLSKPCLEEMRAHIAVYFETFYSRIQEIDDAAFETALAWKDKKVFEVTADGPLFSCGKFIAAKMAELSGDACSVIDSENYCHVNGLMYPGKDIGDMVLIDSGAKNLDRIADTVNIQVKNGGRDVLVFCDREPDKIGITETVRYCPLPMPEQNWSFLAPLLSYVPGGLFAGYRAKELNEPFFRGGSFFEKMTLGTNPIRIV